MPFSEQLRRLKSGLLPYQPPSPGQDTWAIGEGLRQIELLGGQVRDAAVFELGSGWQPMIPLLFSMAGAKRVLMTDLRPLCGEASFRVALQRLRDNKALIQDALGVSDRDFERATDWPSGCSLDEAFRTKRLEYVAPCDARRTGLPDGSVDIVISRAVFEHVRVELIGPIFQECFRILAPGGSMCHVIDNTDHWEHGDDRITRINFLRFSDAAHRAMTLNPLVYTNRVRHPEYREMMQAAGFEIVHDEPRIDQRSLDALKQGLRVAPRFRGLSAEDLAAFHSTFVARKPARAAVLAAGRRADPQTATA